VAILDAYSPQKSSGVVAYRYACALFRSCPQEIWDIQWQLQEAANLTVTNLENVLLTHRNTSIACGLRFNIIHSSDKRAAADAEYAPSRTRFSAAQATMGTAHQLQLHTT
jgi:hypothetical protein